MSTLDHKETMAVGSFWTHRSRPVRLALQESTCGIDATPPRERGLRERVSEVPSTLVAPVCPIGL